MSAVVEESILDGTDEVERMAKRSPDFALIAKAWIRSEVAKGAKGGRRCLSRMRRWQL